MDALTPYRNQGTVHLNWSGSDPVPGTGVTSYDVQTRFGSGAWQTMLAGTTRTEYTFVAVQEGRYAFRVRARDGAHNEGAYSDDAWTVYDVTDPTIELALSEDGAFPRARVLSVIDGYDRTGLPGQEMPEFGLLLEGETVPVDVGDGVLTPTPRPLAALLYYLESIQD